MLASKIADQVAKSRSKTTIVVGFMGPEGKPTELGRELGDEFSTALSQAATGLQIVERARLKEVVAEQRLTETATLDPRLAAWLAKLAGAESVVTGTIERKSDRILISLRVIDTHSRKEVHVAHGDIPRTQLAEELETKLMSTSEKDVPAAGKNGYTYPLCRYCPPPRNAATREGLVVLRITVTAEGLATNIELLKSAGRELDEDAIQTVQKWRFSPGTSPDGRITPLAIPIEIHFRRL